MIEALKNISTVIRTFYWVIEPFALFAVWYFLDTSVKKLIRRFDKATQDGIKHRIIGAVEQRAALQRATTIYLLASQIIRGFIAVGMIACILGSVGIDMGPVIAGVGIVGLALSLAAQNIIRDYLNGFMILVEDQFNVGDVVTVAERTGTVEFFSFRSTKLRSLNGNLITIPNSAILTVENYSKDWSAAVVDIAVSYDSDYKKALEIAAKTAHKMTQDQSNGITEQPVTQGIVTLTDNAIMLRTIIKTIPGQQWAIGRVFRQALKDAYDEQGITLAHSILFSQSTDNAQVPEKVRQ